MTAPGEPADGDGRPWHAPMAVRKTTLAQYLMDERDHPCEPGLASLLQDVSVACKVISRRIALGALGAAGSITGRDETRANLARVAHGLFLESTEASGELAGILSEELALPRRGAPDRRAGTYLLLLDPLDGASNLDVNVPAGSIFSILRAPAAGGVSTGDFLQPGVHQLCAGYAIYGPSTMLVLSVGFGVQGFTLDPHLGEFFLTHRAIRIPETTTEFAINASNHRFWEPAVRRYVDECLAGRSAARGKDFGMRWIASLVAELHRILMHGGVCLFPRDSRERTRRGHLQLLFECNPVAFIVEQAGGASSTGRGSILGRVPGDIGQREGFVFGAVEEVKRIEQFHREHVRRSHDAPLFGSRGLFRNPV